MIKNIFKGIGAVLGAIAIGILLWVVLYLAVPNVKDNTDKMFKWNDYAIEDTIEDEKTETEDNENEDEDSEVDIDENLSQASIVIG